MSSLLLNILILTLGTLFGAGLDRTYMRVRGKSKPSFSFETAQVARDAILTAQKVFGEVHEQSGNLTYPWNVRGDVVYADVLRHSLLAADAAIGNRDFSNSIKNVIDQLMEIERHPYVSVPQVYSLEEIDPPESPRLRKEREESEMISRLQSAAADTGLFSCKVASEKLNSLSKNL